jgi:hypothetical protein
MKAETDLIIWADDGCWFQHLERGIVRSSFLGHVGRKEAVSDWCAQRGIRFEDFAPPGSRSIQLPPVTVRVRDARPVRNQAGLAFA